MSIYDVRLLIGDNDSTDYVLQDVDVAFFLEEASNSIYTAAVMAAESIAAKYARMVTNSQSDVHGNHTLTRNYSDRHKHYLDLAKRLEKRMYSMKVNTMSAGVFAGGISVSDKATRSSNADKVVTAFSKDLHRNNGDDGSVLE